MDFVTCHHGNDGFVQCGAHEAESCDKCVDIFNNVFIKKYLGYTLCNIDCEWDVAELICRDKGTFQAIYPILYFFAYYYSLIIKQI